MGALRQLWYNSGGNILASIDITIASSHVTSDLSGFPIYIDLKDMPPVFFQNIKPDGSNIFIKNSAGQVLPTELLNVDKYLSVGKLYFKGDLSSSVDNVFTLYLFSNSVVRDQLNVWDTNFKMVQHLDNSFSFRYDATVNAILGTPHGDVSQKLIYSPATASYDAFGVLLKTGEDRLTYYFRESPIHVSNLTARVIKLDYTISTDTWSTPIVVYDDNTYGISGVGGGIINGQIFLFFARVDNSGNMQNIGYIKSTDGLEGNTWSIFSSFAHTYTRYEAYGHLRSTGNPNIFLTPWFEHNNGVTDPWRCNVQRTINAGQTWSTITVVDGLDASYKWGEPEIIYIGENRLIMLIRNNANGYLGQSISPDNGATWSAVQVTNIGNPANINNCTIEYDDNGYVTVIYLDRGNQLIKSVRGLANTVFSNPTAYSEPITLATIDGGTGFGVGYPTSAKISNNDYYVVYGIETASNNVNTKGGKSSFSRFNGSDAYIDWGNKNLPNTFTVLAKIKIQATRAIVLSYGAVDANGKIHILGTSNTGVPLAQLSLADNSYMQTTDGSALVDGQEYWVHFVRNGASMNIYVDGIVTNPTISGGSTQTLQATTANLQTAHYNDGTSTFADCDVSEIRLSDIQRSAAWILAEATNLKTPETFYEIADIVAPTLVSAVLINQYTTILTFDKILATYTPDAIDFVYDYNITNVTRNGKTIVITSNQAAGETDTPSITYLPGSNPLQDSKGNLVTAFTSPVVNYVATLKPNGSCSGLALTVLSNTAIKLDWSNGSTDETGISIERSLNGSSWSEIGTVTAGTTTYNSTGLTGGTQYYYRVRAFKNTYYSNYSNIENATTETTVIPEFIFTINTTKPGSATNTFILPTTGAGYDFDVEWETGVTEHYSGTPGNITHVYGSTGVKQIKISGTFPRIYFNNTGDRQKLISVDNFGSFTWATLSNAFYGCVNLTTVVGGPILGTGGNYGGMFRGCNKLVSIDEDLFKYGVDESTVIFNYTFAGCSLLANLHADLFRWKTLSATNAFDHTFYQCIGLITVPQYLFRYNVYAADNAFSSTFEGCTNLAAIPVDFFRYNIRVSGAGFTSTFYGCSSLTYLPDDLFRYNVLVATNAFSSTFNGCYNLAIVPQYTFRYNILAVTGAFANTFKGCNKLQLNKYIFYAEGEQSTRFLNKSVNFGSTFYLTGTFTGTQGEAPDLWNCNFGTGTSVKTDCFQGHTLSTISNFPDVPVAWQ